MEISKSQKDVLLDAKSHANIAVAFVDSIITAEFWSKERAITAIMHLEQSIKILKGLI